MFFALHSQSAERARCRTEKNKIQFMWQSVGWQNCEVRQLLWTTSRTCVEWSVLELASSRSCL